MNESSRRARLLPVDRLVEFLPALHLPSETSRRIINGLGVPNPGNGPGVFRLYDLAGNFIGIGESTSDGLLAAKRLVSQQRKPCEQHVALD
jgi:hypothetical protein